MDWKKIARVALFLPWVMIITALVSAFLWITGGA